MADPAVCGKPSPDLAGVIYYCHEPVGHDGFHRDDLGIVLWDDAEPDPRAWSEVPKRYRP